MTDGVDAPARRWAEAYSAGRAEVYDDFIRLGAMNYDGTLRALVEMTQPPGDAPLAVLELGTGTGLLTEMVLDRFPEATLLGVDGSPQMLSRASARLAPCAGRVRLEARSFEDFLRDGPAAQSLDLIVSSFALHHMDHAALRAAFLRLRRSLRPGGRLVIADYVLTPHAELQRRYEDIWVATRVENARRHLGRALDFHAVRREHEATKAAEGDNPAPLPELLHWLGEAGFSAVECHWKHFCYAVYGGEV